MSEDFNNKNYSEYFNTLEKRVQKNQVNQTVVKTTMNKKIKQSSKPKIYKVFKIKYSFIIIVIICIALLITLIKPKAENNINKKNLQKNISTSEKKSNIKYTKISFNYSNDLQPISEKNNAKNVVVVDLKNNTIIAERDSKKRAYPASTTKILTLLTAVKNVKSLSDTFTMTLDITDPLYKEQASVAGFLNGETVTIEDLLYGTILPSGADAAMGLAVKIAGSEDAFVDLMNKEVKNLGLKDTHFTNVTGLYDENHYTTAYDMSVILKAAMDNEICKEVLSTFQFPTSVTPQHPKGIELTSTLFSYMYGTEPETATIKGGKTGYVNESGYCIATFGENNTLKNQYIVVTLGNSGKYSAVFGQIDIYKQFAK